MSGIRSQWRYMNPYDIHKAVINEYILKKPGDTKQLSRDTSRDRTYFDVVKDNHKFLWDDQTADTWEAQFAKKYYDKLFKEYCIGDLSRYKENKVALRWRTEPEVVLGKGQFICANKKCSDQNDLRTWEVNFAYQEDGQKKNALVKIRLCPSCSNKLNYHSKKREIKRLHHKKHRRLSDKSDNQKKEQNADASTSKTPTKETVQDEATDELETKTIVDSPWENLKPVEVKSREEEMEEYLQELLL